MHPGYTLGPPPEKQMDCGTYVPQSNISYDYFK